MWYVNLIFCALLARHGLVEGYKAAVVEYSPQTADTPDATIAKNLEEYITYADQAKSQGVDIIVFPEYGLTSVGVDPFPFSTEINDDNHVIKKLTAIANERQMYVVVNLLEKAQNGHQLEYYNTNLVFDRNGTIVKKYRKIHLYQEANLTPGAVNQNITFSTDFGPTFAIFTGFDILFKNPSRTVLENSKVTDVIVPTSWISKMPFYLALSVQHGYSLENGVNLLAANYDKPKDGRGGSGIYLSTGKIAEAYLGDTLSSKLLVKEVANIALREGRTVCFEASPLAPRGLPGADSRSNVTDFVTPKDFDASKYQFKNVDLAQGTIQTEICDKKFCCTFEILVANQTDISQIYKVVAFDGIVKYESTDVRLRFCSLLACEFGNDNSCGARINATTKFTKITVKGNLAKDETAYYTPITANSFLLPIRDTSYCNTNNGTNSTFVQLTTTKLQPDVIVFGIFRKTEVLVDPEDPGNHNSDDDDDDDGGSGAFTVQSGSIAILIFAFLTLLNM